MSGFKRLPGWYVITVFNKHEGGQLFDDPETEDLRELAYSVDDAIQQFVIKEQSQQHHIPRAYMDIRAIRPEKP